MLGLKEISKKEHTQERKINERKIETEKDKKARIIQGRKTGIQKGNEQKEWKRDSEINTILL